MHFPKMTFQCLSSVYFLSCSDTIPSAATFFPHPSRMPGFTASYWQTLLEQGANQEEITESLVFI